MNYGKLYCRLMRKALKRNEKLSHYEKHHIFPVSIYGKNDKKVKLTYKEHYLAHVFLAKYFLKRYGNTDTRTRKMHMAVHRMIYTKVEGRDIVQYSKDFERAKIAVKIAKTKAKRLDLKSKRYFGASEERIKEGIEKMKKSLKGRKFPYKPRKPTKDIRTDEWHKNISRGRQKTDEKFINMTIEEIWDWIHKQKKYKFTRKTNYRGANPNITHVLALKNIPYKEYYVIEDFHDGWLKKSSKNQFLFYGS